jgi:hypothetical protein
MKMQCVTELNMEKIHSQIMLSDVGQSSFKRPVVFCTEKEREDREFCRVYWNPGSLGILRVKKGAHVEGV